MIDIKKLTDNELKELIMQATSEQEERRNEKRYQAMLNIKKAIAEYNQLFGALWIGGDIKALALNADDLELNIDNESIDIITD